jgi:hypothetical protein
MMNILAATTIVALASIAPFSAPRPAHDLTGQWSYVEEATVTFQSPGTGTATARCAGLAEGTYDLTQTGDAIAGTYVQTGNCTFRDGTVLQNPSPGGSLDGGTVQNGHVAFTLPGCKYSGTIAKDGQSMEGVMVCFYGKEVKYIGTWSATRI